MERSSLRTCDFNAQLDKFVKTLIDRVDMESLQFTAGKLSLFHYADTLFPGPSAFSASLRPLRERNLQNLRECWILIPVFPKEIFLFLAILTRFSNWKGDEQTNNNSSSSNKNNKNPASH